MDIAITIPPDGGVPFHNRAFFCIGSARMGLALTREYQ